MTEAQVEPRGCPTPGTCSCPPARASSAEPARAERGRPTEAEVLEAVRRHPQGIGAIELTRAFEEQGYHPYNIQRVIQRALDNGSLQLGPKLRLVASSAKHNVSP